MNRKGFTLIELIATIALLAIVTVIAFVSTNKIIEKNKDENCKRLVRSIQTAANEYISDYRYDYNFISQNAIDNNRYHKRINAEKLVDENYLNGTLVDPYTKEEMTDDEISSINVDVYLREDYTLLEAVVTTPEVLSKCDSNYGQTINVPVYIEPVLDTGDNTPPEITILPDKSDDVTYTSNISITITGTDASGIDYLVVEVYKNGSKISTFSKDKTVSPYTFTTNGSGTWEICAVAYDINGNRGPAGDGKTCKTYKVAIPTPTPKPTNTPTKTPTSKASTANTGGGGTGVGGKSSKKSSSKASSSSKAASSSKASSLSKSGGTNKSASSSKAGSSSKAASSSKADSSSKAGSSSKKTGGLAQR